MLVYFTAIWYGHLVWPFGMAIWYIFGNLVYFTKKNLASQAPAPTYVCSNVGIRELFMPERSTFQLAVFDHFAHRYVER
jgi:hypothetical protein